MNFKRILPVAAAAVLMVGVPGAHAKDRVDFSEGETVNLPSFDGLSLKGGGSVTVTPSDEFTVTVTAGGERVEMFMDNESLQIGCRKPCRGNVKREVEVTVPMLDSVAIAGGGTIMFADGFSSQSELNVVVVGGGSLNAYSVSARDVNAAVTGGGSIKVTATEELNAAIVGGGSIKYDGDPQVDKSTIGGGSVSPR